MRRTARGGAAHVAHVAASLVPQIEMAVRQVPHGEQRLLGGGRWRRRQRRKVLDRHPHGRRLAQSGVGQQPKDERGAREHGRKRSPEHFLRPSRTNTWPSTFPTRSRG
eukprot:1654194-Prymnesium_polylepis.1